MNEPGEPPPERKKRFAGNYSVSDVREALRTIELGEMSIRKAGKKYGVPSTTLRDKMSGKTRVECSMGRPPVQDKPTSGKKRKTNKPGVPTPGQKRQVRVKYSLSDVREALRMIELGEMSVRKAGKTYGVPSSTLRSKSSGKTPVDCKLGRSPLMDAEEEEKLVAWVREQASSGQKCTKAQLQEMAKQIMEEGGRVLPLSNNGKPGKRWFDKFKSRHKEVQQLFAQQKADVTIKALDKWFEDLHAHMEAQNLVSILQSADRMWNAGELIFSCTKKESAVLEMRRDKPSSYDDKRISVLEAMSGSGIYIPPMVCLPGNRIPKGWKPLDGAPDSWLSGFSQSGSVNGSLLFRWLTEHFHPYLLAMGIELPVLLLVDPLFAYISDEAGDFCNKNGIILYRFPYRSATLIQPMHLSVFESVQEAYKQAERDWKATHQNDCVTKENFAEVFAAAWAEIEENPVLAQNGFWAAGLCPFDGSYNRALVTPLTDQADREPSSASASAATHVTTSDPSVEIQSTANVVSLSSGSVIVVNASEADQDLLEQALAYASIDAAMPEPVPDSLLTSEEERRMDGSSKCVVCSSPGQRCKRRKETGGGRSYSRLELALARLAGAKQATHCAQKVVKEAVNGLTAARNEEKLAEEAEKEAKIVLSEASRVAREAAREVKRTQTKVKQAERRRKEAWIDVTKARTLLRSAEKELIKANAERAEKDKETRVQNEGPPVDENKCPRCGGDYESGNEEKVWVGCKTCPRRFHIACTDLYYLPAERVAQVSYTCPWCTYS